MKALPIATGLMALAAMATSQAAIINLADFSYTPDGVGTVVRQQGDINTPNGGVVNDNVDGSLSYFVTTFTFGTSSTAHLETFFELSAGQDRLGVMVQDNGLVNFTNQGDTGDTSFSIGGGGGAGFMAGQTVTIIARSYWHSTNDGLRATLGTGDDMLMNVWVNPDGSTPTPADPVAGNAAMLNDGDLHTLWNASDYSFLTSEIQNQNTGIGNTDNAIINTTVFTGADATWANAYAAAVPEPSSLTLLGLGLGGLLLRRRRD